jgi:hypothetical protein
MRLAAHLAEVQASIAVLAACLQAALEEPGPAGGTDGAEFLCAYA